MSDIREASRRFIALAQTAGLRFAAYQPGGPLEIHLMTDAQVGLMFAVPIIAGFAMALHWMGALRTSGAVAAVSLSVLIAAVLFFTQ